MRGGFTGKLCVHPARWDTLNKEFAVMEGTRSDHKVIAPATEFAVAINER